MEEGHEVICIDNMYSGHVHNVEQWIGNPRFTFINHNICDTLSDSQHAALGQIDQIYHLACPASPVHYQADAVQTLKTNVIGTLHMCELAVRHKARLLQASTSEVYGDPEMHPQPEDYFGNVNPCGPRSCYDEGKRAAEALVMDFNRQFSTEVRIVRIFNTYGPRMLFHDGRVVSNFLVQALKGDAISIYGDGLQTRSFCYVSDLVCGLMRLMNQDATLGPVNIGNPREFTVAQLAQLVKNEIGNDDLKLEYRPLPRDDPKRRQPDITKAKQLLNWEPVVTLEEGLKLTAADFKTRALKDPHLLFCLHQQDAQSIVSRSA